MHISQTVHTGRRKGAFPGAGGGPACGCGRFYGQPFSAAAVLAEEKDTWCTDVYYINE